MKFPTYSDIQPETAATQTKESAGKPSTFGKFKNLFTKKRQPDALPISARAAAVTDDDTPIHGPARTWQQAFNTEAGLEEGIKAELTREKLADVWLPDAYRPAPIAQLVALAAHACHSSSPDNGTSSFVSKAKEPADSVFRECLHSSQVSLHNRVALPCHSLKECKGMLSEVVVMCIVQRTFLCAEANLGPSTGLPVLVFAISDRVLSWTEYAQHLPIGPQDQIPGRQGHFHPSVHKAVTKVRRCQLQMHEIAGFNKAMCFCQSALAWPCKILVITLHVHPSAYSMRDQ